MSLQTLCICDQDIQVMEGLDLPNLRELFLHRNNITAINGLHGCPRLKKLWLFQNKITEISDLHAVSELEECWLQANQISKLDGLEYNTQLRVLGLAGNPIREFAELDKLAHLSALREVQQKIICSILVDMK